MSPKQPLSQITCWRARPKRLKPEKPKAYWIANVTVTDADAYKGYQALAPAAFAAHGATFLARGDAETLEGTAWQRRVVIEFPNIEAARACYQSAEYTAARQNRDGACVADIALIEGV